MPEVRPSEELASDHQYIEEYDLRINRATSSTEAELKGDYIRRGLETCTFIPEPLE